MKPISLSLPSFAKINWNLKILGKRPDGYHEVRTILQTISLRDELQVEVGEEGRVSLSCDDPDVPTDDRNLAVKAAGAFVERFNVKKGLHIQIEKRIPTKAGLGGASSNAAMTLLALTRLLRIAASQSELLEIAASLGADVPFFLIGGCALATGTGTEITESPEPEATHLIVITPNASVSTVEAYAALSSTALTAANSDSILSSSPEAANFRESLPWMMNEKLSNDFESVIFDIEPEIKRAKEALGGAGASAALMAGSGSSVFGIFADRKAQQSAVDEIKLEAGWRIFACDTVSRSEYYKAFKF